VVVIGWVAATPFTLRQPRVVQRVGFALIGPAQLSMTELRALPHHEQITQHFCIQGWSGVGQMGRGVDADHS
jgi:DMSO/TMAO reductase YedYZ molybdopterin-dependent catalytic subunit